MGAHDYRHATAGVPVMPLDGAVVPASWDAELAPVMRAANQSVAEESLAETLLRDLAQAG